MRCHAINVKVKQLLNGSAVQVLAGDGKDDRITSGSYITLRNERARRRDSQEGKPAREAPGEYLPDFLK
jgi:hypothetical protein